MVRVSRPSGGSDTSQRNRNNISDLLIAMPVKVFIKEGKSATKLRLLGD